MCDVALPRQTTPLMPATDLALDLSTKTGWALGRSGQNSPPLYGRWVLPRRPTLIKRDLQIGYRMSCLAAQLTDAIAIHQPTRVVFEAPLHIADGSSRLLINLAGVVEMICDEHDLPCEEANISSVRLLVLGSGRLAARDKTERVMGFCRDQGWAPVDDNVADALILLRYLQIMRRARVTA